MFYHGMVDIKLGRRKICAINYTRTVSLPKVWLENVGLKPNDMVELGMNDDGSLVIKATKEKISDERESG